MPRSLKPVKSASVVNDERLRRDAQALPPPERVRARWMFGVALLLSLFVLGTYARVYTPKDGWSRLDAFGSEFADRALPRLKRAPHQTVPGSGQDGQFYAQMAIDPPLQDPAFDQALDNPTYRSRRIGLPAMSFCLGWGKPRRIIQAYALSNLLFWFVLCGTLSVLYQPWTGKQVACFAASLVGFGSIASMESSFVDLPATALICVGLAAGGWGRFGALAAATLTRETSLLAAVAGLEWRGPWNAAWWKRNAGFLALAVGPFALWMVYIRFRFHQTHDHVGSSENFALPLQAIAARLASGVGSCLSLGLGDAARAAGPFGWLYLDEPVHEVLTVVALVVQGAYLVWRRDWQSPIWRTGIVFAVLGCFLGPAVWDWTAAAARVLLPMTLCFYLLLARERDARFAPFFVGGSLAVPFAVHHFWVL